MISREDFCFVTFSPEVKVPSTKRIKLISPRIVSTNLKKIQFCGTNNA